MEEYTQITLDEWIQWREDIRKKLAETAGNFVHIGYRLKQIRDSGMYDGAADIFEFAEKEYGLGKSTVSRFIAINERYSEDGNSLELKEEFKGFSSSKLAEMLTIPDSEIQLITEKTTIREIRELKSFNGDAEREKTGAAGDEEGSVPAQEWTPLEKCLIDFFKDKKEVLNGVVMHLDADPAEYKQAAEMMAPSGQASHRKGIMFLFMYDWNTGIKYKLMTEPDPVSMSWMELLNTVYHIFGASGQEDVWGGFYGELENAVPAQSNQGLEESVATSQQESDESEAENEQLPAPDMEEEGVEDDEKIPEEPETTSTEPLSEEGEEDGAAGQEDMEAEETVDAGSPDEDRQEKRSIAEQKKEQKTDTDTTEEEKAYASSLHTLRTLEKYNIYLSDEEISILERMLENCKRRKREYGLDDVGSTL